ncbi:hypothetical protein DPMN_118478 [Dreissena polymorpha]|uniref:Uncharacterized protein n=1 Tax=Dreissena polymorpha TaxID=45954 RepID=A0A9D4GHH4_DREPO|nr:hypothetical protein DPMN_118478 [Dreissena polymorpha]
MSHHSIPRLTQMNSVAIGDLETKLSSDLRSFLTYEYLEKIKAIVQSDEYTDAHLQNGMFR